MNVTSRQNAVTDAVRSTAANDVDLDMIFAAIEAHRRAEAEFSAALGRLSDLENELPEKRRRSEINMGVLAIVSKDDPRWIEIQRTVMATCKITDEAATNQSAAPAISRIHSVSVGCPSVLLLQYAFGRSTTAASTS